MLMPMHVFISHSFGLIAASWVLVSLSLAAVLLALAYLVWKGSRKPGVLREVNKKPKPSIAVSVAAENIQESASQLQIDRPILDRAGVEKEKFAAGKPTPEKAIVKPRRSYHAFISYNREDEADVRNIYEYLTDHGLKLWLDTERVKPGDDWLESMQDGLENSRACLVFYGDEPSVWQRDETKHAIRKRSNDSSFKIIPILLPGSTDADSNMPAILTGTAWVDLRERLNLKALKRLAEAIRDSDLVAIHQVPADSQPDSGLPTGYRADVKKIIALLIGDALYSRRDVCIRELIQNAVDACERVGDARSDGVTRAEITISINTKEGYFEVIDNGDGMSAEVLSEYFAVIGRSIRDEERIMQRAQGDEKTRAHLIGKFGIGFISTYMLAKQILISTTNEGSQQVNLEINSISDPFVYHDTSQVARPPEEIGTTIRVYLKDQFLPGGPNALDLTATIQDFCRHVDCVTVFKDGAKVLIEDTWNIKGLNIVDVTDIPFKFELRLGLSKESEDFFASNAGFLVSRSSDQISPEFMPINIGGEINFYPGIVDLNMARDTIIANDKSEYVRRLVSKATKNLLLRVASEGNDDERKAMRQIIVTYLQYALMYEKQIKNAPAGSQTSSFEAHVGSPPLTSLEAADLLMDTWEVELDGNRIPLRSALGIAKDKGKNRVYSRRRHYGGGVFDVIEQSLKKQSFVLLEFDSFGIQFKSGKRDWLTDREALEYLSKRYYFDVHDVENPFKDDIEDLTVSKEVLSPLLKQVIDEIESSTGMPVQLSKLKGAPVVFHLSGQNYLNIGSKLLSKGLASSGLRDKSIMKSYILGLLQYEIR